MLLRWEPLLFIWFLFGRVFLQLFMAEESIRQLEFWRKLGYGWTSILENSLYPRNGISGYCGIKFCKQFNPFPTKLFFIRQILETCHLVNQIRSKYLNALELFCSHQIYWCFNAIVGQDEFIELARNEVVRKEFLRIATKVQESQLQNIEKEPADIYSGMCWHIFWSNFHDRC